MKQLKRIFSGAMLVVMLGTMYGFVLDNSSEPEAFLYSITLTGRDDVETNETYSWTTSVSGNLGSVTYAWYYKIDDESSWHSITGTSSSVNWNVDDAAENYVTIKVEATDGPITLKPEVLSWITPDPEPGTHDVTVTTPPISISFDGPHFENTHTWSEDVYEHSRYHWHSIVTGGRAPYSDHEWFDHDTNWISQGDDPDSMMFDIDQDDNDPFFQIKLELNDAESTFKSQAAVPVTIGPPMPKRSGRLLPTEYSLDQNYPNPFNPVTTIRYKLPEASPVTLIIYDVLGKEVAKLVNEHKEAGAYSVTWDASNIASGTYFYTLTAGDVSVTKRLLLLKEK